MSIVTVTILGAKNNEEETELTASNPTVSAFFKAYAQVSPKMKKAKSKEVLLMIEEATSILNKISKALGAKKGKKGKKKGFASVKVPNKSERLEGIGI